MGGGGVLKISQFWDEYDIVVTRSQKNLKKINSWFSHISSIPSINIRESANKKTKTKQRLKN